MFSRNQQDKTENSDYDTDKPHGCDPGSWVIHGYESLTLNPSNVKQCLAAELPIFSQVE